MTTRTPKLQCPCCGSYTLGDRGVREVCEVCLWEDVSADDVYAPPGEDPKAVPLESQARAAIRMVPRAEQFSGALLGQCLGDALGFPVEGHPPEVCARYVAALDPSGERSLRGRGRFPFGQYTDDSQLARELLQSVVACRRFDPADFAARIAAIFAEERIVGRGRATEAAALRLVQGVPWQRAGTPAPAAGNGSAMRAGPVGLVFWSDPDALVQAAHDQGRITHQDPRCSAGAVAVAGAVALALHPGPLDPAEFVRRLVGWVRPIDGGVADAFTRLPAWLRLPPGRAAAPIAALGRTGGRDDGWQGISPFVTGSVVWSLYSFLRSPDDYWTTICTAIAVGGDVDTTAAMAGAISGARVGLAGLPAALVRRVEDRGSWGYDALVTLAESVHALATGPAA